MKGLRLRLKAWLNARGTWWLKGATAYEFQFGEHVFRVCHLLGGYWTWWAFWRRFSYKRFPKDDSCS